MFKIRNTKPSEGNKSYIRLSSGGWNSCIKGYPTDKYCDVLANCVGYANGRFNEIITELTGYQGNKYNTLNCNAENFIERAKSAGLEIGQTPKAGAIMCWEGKGNLAGHVAIVEEVIDNNHVYTSESSYGGKAFFNANRYNNNGRWGTSSDYPFRGFIYNPEVKEKTKYLNLSPTVSSWTVYKTNNYYIPSKKSDVLIILNPHKFNGLSYKIYEDKGNYHFKIKTANAGYGYIAGNPKKYPCTITDKPVYNNGCY